MAKVEYRTLQYRLDVTTIRTYAGHTSQGGVMHYEEWETREDVWADRLTGAVLILFAVIMVSIFVGMTVAVILR